MEPSPVSTPSEMSVSWSEGGEPDEQMGNDVSVASKIVAKTKRRLRRTCTTKLLNRRLPIIEWLPKYTLASALSDFIAGITVALTAIPQGIAYGAVAGVPVEVKENFEFNLPTECCYLTKRFVWTVWIIHGLCGTFHLHTAGFRESNHYGSDGSYGADDSSICSAWRSPVRYSIILSLWMPRVTSWIAQLRYCNLLMTLYQILILIIHNP